jgi:tRNA(Ile)-lysidine synthase
VLTASGSPPDAAEFDAAFAPWAHATILLAVSGGPDSIALAGAATQWRARRPGLPLSAAIVDHALREGSDAEAHAALSQCDALGLPARILRWEDAQPGAGLQERARTARYALLARAAREAGAGVVMTAHHADDQVETILFRLLRGSAPAGLAGMAASAHREGVEIARPFLDFPKTRLLAYVAARGLAFAQDPSNDDPRFARARLRDITPALAREGGAPERFARLARRLRRAEAALEAATDAALRECAGESGLDARALFALPEEIRLRVLRRLVAAQSEGEPRLDRLEAFETRLRQAHQAGRPARLTLGDALADLYAGRLTLRPAPPRRAPKRRGDAMTG